MFLFVITTVHYKENFDIKQNLNGVMRELLLDAIIPIN